MYNRTTSPQHPSLRQSSLTTLLKSLSLLAIAFALLTAAPLHAQARAPIHKVLPVYPPIARQMGISGTVVVMATVDPSGKVVKADSTSGNKALVTAAVDAVEHWKFTPGDHTDILVVSVDFNKE